MRNKISTLLLLVLVCLILVIPNYCDAGEKREFRAVWVATVASIDYPSERTTDAASLMRDWISLIEHHQRLGINALIVQVRPVGDAIYPSSLVPYSHYITGKQGQSPLPLHFDLLKFMIKEAHLRGMEFHAWFNPFRATPTLDLDMLSPKHMLRQHPDWGVRYGDKWYFNPAIPEVRNHFTAVVAEVVQRYDIDGVHFDDYFYPYKVRGEFFDDIGYFQQQGQQFETIGDWRRHNIDLLIEQVSKTIKLLKPTVRFGISPFGVWRNHEDDKRGSRTNAGMSTYDDLYADVIKWLRMDWIDYVAPQMYWHIGHPKIDFQTLLKWWVKNSYGKQLYVGHGLYRVGNSAERDWSDPTQIPRQIQIARRIDGVNGQVFYSSRALRKDPLGVSSFIQNNIYNQPAFLPNWSSPVRPLPPAPMPRIRKIRSKNGIIKVYWKVDRKAEQPVYYGIYRYEGKRKSGDTEDGKNLLAITLPTDETELVYADSTPVIRQKYSYQVSALRWRDHYEGEPSNIRVQKASW